MREIVSRVEHFFRINFSTMHLPTWWEVQLSTNDPMCVVETTVAHYRTNQNGDICASKPMCEETHDPCIPSTPNSPNQSILSTKLGSCNYDARHHHQPFRDSWWWDGEMWKNVTTSHQQVSHTSLLLAKAMLVQHGSRMILAWSLHFASCIWILLYGSNANQGKR